MTDLKMTTTSGVEGQEGYFAYFVVNSTVLYVLKGVKVLEK